MALFKKSMSLSDASKLFGMQAHNVMYPANARDFIATVDPTKDKLELVYSFIGNLISAELFFVFKEHGKYDINLMIDEACEFASLMNGNRPQTAIIKQTCINNIDTINNSDLSANEAIAKITDNYINQNGLLNISDAYANNFYNNIIQIKKVVDAFFDDYKIVG